MKPAADTAPDWIEAAMAARNRIVGLVGLKNLGGLSQLQTDSPAASYQVGDRVGIFTLLERHADEVLLGDRDKHLDLVVAVHRAVVGDAVVTAEGASSQPLRRHHHCEHHRARAQHPGPPVHAAGGAGASGDCAEDGGRDWQGVTMDLMLAHGKAIRSVLSTGGELLPWVAGSACHWQRLWKGPTE